MIVVALAAGAGTLVGAAAGCVPGLHVYNVLALPVLWLAPRSRTVPAAVAVPFACGVMVGFCLCNTIPSILLAAPDESAFFTVLPGQKMLAQGRGHEACLLTALGGMGALLFLTLVAGPLAPRALPPVRDVLRPHGHWALWCVIVFMMMSEWPKPMGMRRAGWPALGAAWRSLGFGWLTFLLSGWLGFILLFRSPIAPERAFQNLMPAFVGLFTLPWLVLNLVARVEVPAQRRHCGRLPGSAVLQGTAAGTLGGAFAVFFPAVTAGVGGLLSGHASGLRDDRAFLVSQGASKMIYGVGAMLLLFAPGVGMVRGGGAWLTQSVTAAGGLAEYYAALAALALGGALALCLFNPMVRLTLYGLRRIGSRAVSRGALGLAVALVWLLTGAAGVTVMLVALGIGLIPVLFGARRMNALGVILLPMACILSGHGPRVAQWLGLM